MRKDTIAEVGIDNNERLYVRPSTASFDHIYRAAMEVSWDTSCRQLFSPKPREWTYVMWFVQILAAAKGEYGTQLDLTPDTVWTNIPESIKSEIMAI